MPLIRTPYGYVRNSEIKKILRAPERQIQRTIIMAERNHRQASQMPKRPEYMPQSTIRGRRVLTGTWALLDARYSMDKRK